MHEENKDWHEWRSHGIGSSEIAAILGVSPYTTELELYEQKTGLRVSNVDNPAVYHGQKFEPKARAYFELTHDRDYPPKNFQSLEYPFMRASLDGWNAEHREVLEIKCPGKATMELASAGMIPLHYQAQVQWQLFVANAVKGIFFAFDPLSERGHEIEMFPDVPFIENMIEKAKAFWMRVQRREPPPVSDRDWVALPDEAGPLAELWKVQREFKLERESWTTRHALLKFATHPRMRGFGITISRTKNRGDKGDAYLVRRSSSP